MCSYSLYGVVDVVLHHVVMPHVHLFPLWCSGCSLPSCVTIPSVVYWMLCSLSSTIRCMVLWIRGGLVAKIHISVDADPFANTSA